MPELSGCSEKVFLGVGGLKAAVAASACVACYQSGVCIMTIERVTVAVGRCSYRVRIDL